MKTSILFLLLFPLLAMAEPPFTGIGGSEHNFLYDTDPTTFVNATYMGMGERQKLDANPDGSSPARQDVYLFEAQYEDGFRIEFQVDPAFSSAQASTQVDIYAKIIGRLPLANRSGLQIVWLRKDHLPSSCGCTFFALVNMGAFVLPVETAEEFMVWGGIEEVLAHETSHVSLDTKYSGSPLWKQAQEADGQSISLYARDRPGEDPTESYLAWLTLQRPERIDPAVIKLIKETIPNRLLFLDSFYKNLSPMVEAEEFEINAGLNDAWYNPLTPGQGFFFTVFPDIKLVFLAWFTYDVERPPEDYVAILGEPGHRWLTAFGSYEGNTTTLAVELTTGGVFNQHEPEVTQDYQGARSTIVVEFADCTSGLVSYDITQQDDLTLKPRLTGQVPIQRLAFDGIPLCEALRPPK